MLGCTDSRNGSTFETMPGMRRETSSRPATGRPKIRSACTGDPMLKDRYDRANQPRKARAGSPRDRAKVPDRRLLQTGGAAVEAIASCRRTSTQANTIRFGSRNELIKPILSVLPKLLGRTIGGIFADQNSKRTKCTVLRDSFAKLRVDFCNSARYQPHAERVHNQMVVARIPQGPSRRRFEQGKTKHRSTCWIDRPRQISLHPCFGRSPWIRLGADIDDGKQPCI